MTLSLMTTKEAALSMRLSVRTLERYRQNHDGPVFIRIGRLVFYDRIELTRWLEANRTLV